MSPRRRERSYWPWPPSSTASRGPPDMPPISPRSQSTWPSPERQNLHRPTETPWGGYVDDECVDRNDERIGYEGVIEGSRRPREGVLRIPRARPDGGCVGFGRDGRRPARRSGQRIAWDRSDCEVLAPVPRAGRDCAGADRIGGVGCGCPVPDEEKGTAGARRGFIGAGGAFGPPPLKGSREGAAPRA